MGKTKTPKTKWDNTRRSKDKDKGKKRKNPNKRKVREIDA
jgi:hypothetical protein